MSKINFQTRRLLMLVWAITVLSMLGCHRTREVQVLKLAHILDSTHPVHRGMAYMGQRLSELSGGAMRLEIFPSGQLGNERECLELVQLGVLDMTKVASSVIENFVPAMAVYSLPYLFQDDEHYWRVFNSDVGKEILLQGEPFLLRGLCYYDAGFRSFFVRDRAITRPEDLHGLKIRVMRSNLSIQTINLLGGNATPMSYGELYTALQQGVVDGAENNPPNFYQSNFYEVCKFYSLDEHSAPPDVLVIGTHTWNKLTEQQQAWLTQAVKESVVYQRQLWAEATEEGLRAVQAAGVTVIRPDKRLFRESVASLYENLKGSDLGRWVDRIRDLENRENSVQKGVQLDETGNQTH